MKNVSAAALAAISLFMVMGFLRSGASLAAPATIAALALTVLLPAVGAGLLVNSHRSEGARLRGRKALLRRQTIEAEILRLAGERGGRLTAVEVAMQLTMTPEDARSTLDALTTRGQADLEVTDAGVLVYSFYDVRHLGGKASAKGVLDA
jgi:hypothetical protein